MLEMVLLENRALKAELAQLKGTPDPANPSHATTTAEPAPRATGSSGPETSELAELNSASAMDTVLPTSPPPKRRAKESRAGNQTEPIGPDTPVNYVTEDILQKFGEQISETLSQTLGATFDTMLSKFADNIGAQIASLNARVAALENAPLRSAREGGAGPIKPSKPYLRPPSADSFKNSPDHA